MRPADGVKLPYRVLHLPLAFNERWTHDAISRYMRSVRSEAPYLPSNVKFIAANNGGSVVASPLQLDRWEINTRSSYGVRAAGLSKGVAP